MIRKSGNRFPVFAKPASLSHAPWRAARRLRSCKGRCRRLGAAGLRRLLVDHAPPRDVLVVLLVTVGEDVAAGAVGDEKQLLGARRVGGGFERGAAGIGD